MLPTSTYQLKMSELNIRYLKSYDKDC
jgi:hypothetical protein